MGMVSVTKSTSSAVPFHSLGLSQIISFGLLFYVFAQLKTPLAQTTGASETQILAAVTGALTIQALLAPVIGSWSDRYGALRVMTGGFLLGGIGMAMLPLHDSLLWVWMCMLPVGLGFAMSSYEVAFIAAVQLDEAKARRNISFITFYGGVASSVTWLAVAPLLAYLGFAPTCYIIAIMLGLTGLWAAALFRKFGGGAISSGKVLAPFRWAGLTRSEKLAIFMLGSGGLFEYLAFSSASMLWITWFQLKFGDPALAVMLAALYGPFQVVGRMIEMFAGHRFDARITGMIAFTLGPVAMWLAQGDSIATAVLAMMLFGMGHGVLTVSYGYVTNMYFRAEIYGRAKGWITTPRALGIAVGPTMGGLLFAKGADVFFPTIIAFMLIAAVTFAVLFLAKTRPGTV
jgi:MFS family permease